MSSVFPIIDDPRYRRYTASAGQTTFSIPFPFQQVEDITVLLQVATAEYAVIPSTDYQISGSNEPSGGTLSFPVGRAANDVILILGDAILDRLTSIVRDGKFSSYLMEGELDRIRIIEQEFRRDASRALKVDYGAAPYTIEANVTSGSILYIDGHTIRGGSQHGSLEEAVSQASAYAGAAQASENASRNFALQAQGYANQSAASAGQAQNLVDAAQAAYVGFQPGTFYDLGRLEDEITLFPGDLGRLENL